MTHAKTKAGCSSVPLDPLVGRERLVIPEVQRELVRREFEYDAKQYGFDLTRYSCAAPDPWIEYTDAATGHRWAGWLAANGLA